MSSGVNLEDLCTFTNGVNVCSGERDSNAIKIITEKYFDYFTTIVQQIYDNVRENVTTGLTFEKLPRALRTSIVFAHYINKHSTNYKDLWRLYAQQNWESVHDYLSDLEVSTSSAAYKNRLTRLRSLSENVNLRPCKNTNSSFNIIILVDTADKSTAQTIVDHFLGNWSSKNYINESAQITLLTQANVNSVSSFTKMSTAIDNKITIESCSNNVITTLLQKAKTLFENKATYSMNVFRFKQRVKENRLDSGASPNVLVYIGSNVQQISTVFPYIIQLVNIQTLIYVIQPTIKVTNTDLKYLSKWVSGIEYNYNETDLVVEAIYNWTDYACAIPTPITATCSYSATEASENYTSANQYFQYVALSTNNKAQNVTVQISLENNSSVELYYSIRYKFPGSYLRDGNITYHKIFGYAISFSLYKEKSSLYAATYYFSVRVGASQTVNINIIEGSTPLLGVCGSGCRTCDLNGKRCFTCKDYYENIRGECWKGFEEDTIPLSDKTEHSDICAYLVVFGILLISGVLACVIHIREGRHEKLHQD